MIELKEEYDDDDYQYPFIGWADVEFEWELQKGEIGIAIHPRFWGNGFSGERAEALIDLAFWYDGIDVVETCLSPENENSVRAECAGVIKNYHNIDGQGVTDAVLFQVTEDAFESNL